MTVQLDRRLAKLEAQAEVDRIVITVISFVAPGRRDEEPVGVNAVPPYLPALDRLPGESFKELVHRAGAMVSHLPPSVRVVATARYAARTLAVL